MASNQPIQQNQGPPQGGVLPSQAENQNGAQTIQPNIFPAMPYAAIPVGPDAVPSQVYTRSLSLAPDEEVDLLRACNNFKINTINHAKNRKLNQERNYAYFNSQFFGDDLLPTPSSEGDQRDVNSQRPQVFLPIMLEQILQIYAFLRVKLFPNDEDYFRVKAKTEEYAYAEDDLTEGLKYLFKKNKIIS